MKTILPILLAVLFLFAPALPALQGLAPKDANAPEIPFHTSAYTEGKALPQHIEETTTIGPEDGIILVHGTVTIHEDAALTIKPGTTIAVSEYGSLRVYGRLEAKGTGKTPIQFISNEKNQTNRNWSGITYEKTGSGIIEHAIFHHASPGVGCSLPGKATLSNNKYLFGNLELYGPC